MMKLTRERALELQAVLTQLVPNDRNRDTVPKDISWSVNYGMGRNLSKLRVINQETSDQSELVQQQLRALNLQYCAKDDDGKPVIVNGEYQGLAHGTNPDYDTAAETITKEHRAYMRQTLDFDEYHIKGQPPKGSAIWALLCDFFDEPTADTK